MSVSIKTMCIMLCHAKNFNITSRPKLGNERLVYGGFSAYQNSQQRNMELLEPRFLKNIYKMIYVYCYDITEQSTYLSNVPEGSGTVSYTHLDVYKRQNLNFLDWLTILLLKILSKANYALFPAEVPLFPTFCQCFHLQQNQDIGNQRLLQDSSMVYRLFL